MIILDTHAWLWWSSEAKKLSSRARATIDAATEIGICAISCWELAMLVKKGRLGLDRDVLLWIRQNLAQPRVNLLPLSPEVAVTAANFDDFSGDPADRMIVATALHHQAKLVSKDRRIRTVKQLETVW